MISFVAGPAQCSERVLRKYATQFLSPDLEPEFLTQYKSACTHIASALHKSTDDATKSVAIMSGEGMVALWAGLKSCLTPGDKVLSISTGVFGTGIGEMAKSCGATVNILEFGMNTTLTEENLLMIEKAAVEFKPKMITVVHCETPSGTLNPVSRVGAIKRKLGIPLLYTDIVSSAWGAPVDVDAWGIDVAVGAPHKCLAAPPSVAFVVLSEPAWNVVRQVNYSGYDALLPFLNAYETFYFPYTPNWHGIGALCEACDLFNETSPEAVYAAHVAASRFCRERIVRMGLSLFPVENAVSSPSVTAVIVPSFTTWRELDAELRKRGVILCGSYGPLTGKVFRIGHMGPVQTDMGKLAKAMDVLQETLEHLKTKSSST
ncbi:alanine--glyoxylate aminotransferase family protein [Pelomyxa schiedti]|nr:alanine--glyoxylate aminotransferase family protein [Pelomyxa schiedti]